MKEWTLGPDTFFPSSSLTASKLDEGVNLRYGDDIMQIKSESIYTKFRTVVEEIPMYPALAYKENEKWVYVKYEEYWKLCNQAAKSFIKVNCFHNE